MTGDRLEIHGAFSFVVQIDGIENAVFHECTLPTLEVEVEEEKERLRLEELEGKEKV